MSVGVRGTNGRSTSKQDYTNLLFSDSDSDRVPDLKLPPVKSKKLRKRKLEHHQEGSGCEIWTLMKTFLLLIILATIIVLAGLNFWSLQKINSLQEKVDKLQQSEAFSPKSMTNLQTQLVTLNKSLTELKTGPKGINALATSIGTLDTKMRAFNDDTKTALDSSKELIDLPKKLNDLFEVVKTMGDKVDDGATKSEELEKRLIAVEEQSKTTQNPENIETSKRGDTSATQLEQKVNLINETMLNGFETCRHQLDHQEMRISALEHGINSSAEGASFAFQDMNIMIQKSVQDAMMNLTNISLPGSEELSRIMESMNDLTKQVQMFTENGVEQKYLLFEEEMRKNFKAVNASLVSFDDELQELSSHIFFMDAFMKNMTTFVETVGSELNIEKPVSDKGPETTSSTTNPTTPEEQSETTTLSSDDTQKTTTEKEKTTPEEQNSEISPSESEPVIRSQSITSMAELHQLYMIFNSTGDGLNSTQLETLLSDSNLTLAQIDAIDQNKDNLYSESEIAAAMGFTQGNSSLASETH